MSQCQSLSPLSAQLHERKHKFEQSTYSAAAFPVTCRVACGVAREGGCITVRRTVARVNTRSAPSYSLGGAGSEVIFINSRPALLIAAFLFIILIISTMMATSARVIRVAACKALERRVQQHVCEKTRDEDKRNFEMRWCPSTRRARTAHSAQLHCRRQFECDDVSSTRTLTRRDFAQNARSYKAHFGFRLQGCEVG